MESPRTGLSEIRTRELDCQRRNGIEIILWWLQESNTLSMTLNDENANKTFNFPVPNDKGLEALAHPYVYKDQSETIGRELFGVGQE